MPLTQADIEMLRRIIREELSRRETPESSIADVIRTQGWEAAKKIQHSKLRRSK